MDEFPKVLLYVWWDWKRIIYYELHAYGQTLNTELICQQLERLKKASAQQRPTLANKRGVLFHQDNNRPHTSIVTRSEIMVERLNPAYSRYQAPSDCYLFPHMTNDFSSRKACKNRLYKRFYESGIMKIPSKWQHVVEQNGTYLT